MGVIGDTLFEARTRRAVDLEEVHAATGIRVRYLQAIEDEEWDALPEEFYARSFIRKYARYLGVDPEPLVEEYRRQRGAAGNSAEAPTSPFARTSSRRAEALRRRRARQGVYAWVGGAAVLVAIVVAIVLLASGGGGGGGTKSGGTAASKPTKSHRPKSSKAKSTAKPGSTSFVTLRLEPIAEVWACVLDAKGKPLVDGATLAAGETAGPFHSRAYSAAFGNGSVAVSIDGKPVRTPSTPSPMGFTVDSHGKLHELPEGERPSCE